jgi:uncharacterized membrane protein HdeD (DUF308 family)
MSAPLDRIAAHLSAKQTAALCLCGGLIAASGFLAMTPMRAAKHHHPNTGFWVCAAAGFLLILIGYGIVFFAKSQLENGIAAERWPDDEIESLRNLLKSPLTLGCNIALFIAMVAFFLFDRRNNPAGWACFVLSQAISQLSFATRRPRDNDPFRPPSIATWPGDTHSLAPIQSQHWGER